MHIADIAANKLGPVPDVMILTKTKAKIAQMHTIWARMMRKNYHMYHSTVPATEHSRAGVLIAVSKRLTELGQIRQEPLPKEVHGYMLHVVVENPDSNPLHILGVYCPPQSTAQDLRNVIYAQCKATLAATPHTHHTTIVAGDFNATIQDLDRYRDQQHTETCDRMHRKFLQEAQLCTVDPPTPGCARRHSYRKHTSSTPCSRIDDIYLNLPREEIASAKPEVEFVDMSGICTDHDMMCAKYPTTV